MEAITNYIPHRKEMVLIENITNFSEDAFEVSLEISKTSVLYKKDLGCPSYCSIEYMAQSIAAYNSIHFESRDKVNIGFLVAVRKFCADREFFKLGDKITIKVKPILYVENSGSFECEVLVNNEISCKSRLTAYVPSAQELKKLKGLE